MARDSVPSLDYTPTVTTLVTGNAAVTVDQATHLRSRSLTGRIGAEISEVDLAHLDDLGSQATYNHYPTGWACAFNTPLKLWKRYSNWEGGTADPMIVSWPARITSPGVRRQYVHAIDIVPTLYSVLGIEPPEVVKGYTQFPMEGVSFEATLNDAEATTDKQTQFYSMGGTRAIWHQGWKAAAISPAAPDMWAN